MATALDNLKALRNAAHDALPSEVAEWLTTAIDAYLANGGTIELDKLLGVRGAGIRLPKTQKAKALRDQALINAYTLFLPLNGESETKRRERFAMTIRTFDRRIDRIRRCQRSGTPVSPLDAALARVFEIAEHDNIPVPCSQKGLYPILRNTPPIPENE